MRLITFSFLFFYCMSTSSINAQCSSSIATIKVYQESFSSISTVEVIPNGLKLDTNGHLCTDFATMLDMPPESFGSNIDITQSTNTSARRQAMVFYHVSAAREWANASLPLNLISTLDGNLEFKVEDVGIALFMVDKPGKAAIDYRKRDSQDADVYHPAYNAFAEDAFAIASGYFQAAHINSLSSIGDPDKGKLPQEEGVLFSISDYLAYRYMSTKGYNTGTQMYVHAGVGSDDWVTLDIDYSKIGYEYGNNQFNNQKSQKQSELLSAALNQLTLLLNADGNGKAMVDAMVVNAMVNLNNFTVVKGQGDAAKILYSQAITNGLGETDLCIILEFFTEVYGNAFFDEGTTFVPPAANGDIYIKDNADHLVGQEITSGLFTNSPSIWNSYSPNLSVPGHQNPYALNAPSTQYVKIAIDGNFCDLQNLKEVVGDVKYKIYRSVLQLGYQWPMDWNNVNVHDAPEADLIGTFTVLDDDVYIGGVLQSPIASFRDDQDQVLFTGDDIPFSNEGNLLIIAIPWEVPDYLYDVYLPNISPKDNTNLGLNFQDAFLVRIESTMYDPIANAEVQNVFMNVKNNNNIAMKTTTIVIGSECVGCNGNTPATLLTNDNSPDDVVIKLEPSTHDPVRPVSPNPISSEPFIPIRPEFNNFMDYGEVRIVLDEDTHLDWVASGSQGSGFVVNIDNEIVVTRSDFTLRGIPRMITGSRIRAIGVRYYPTNGIFTSRTGFDLVAENSIGDFIGSTHYEVRQGDGGSAPRRSNKDEITESITIYPNPVNGDIIHLDNITTDGTYTILGLDGKVQARGKYTKDQKSLDISLLDNGVYFLRFAMNNGTTETKKLIKI